MNPTLFLLLFFQVRGVVYDPSGRPVEGAQVACGAETKTTDLQGAFEVSSACAATITKPGRRTQSLMGRHHGKWIGSLLKTARAFCD